jgi:3-dehydroquinate synthase
LLGRIDPIGQHLVGRDVLVVSNTTVRPLYGPSLLAQLAAHRVIEVVLPDGEEHKSLSNVARILDVMVANRMNRDCTAVALGGGVVGDITGFAAACYQRGVAYVQIPTTLLAQVDSSVGGKTGVNHPGGKNLIGAFHQPRAVISDTDTLATLPPRELRAGIAEVIKYGLIRDADFFAWLESSMDALLRQDATALTRAIRRSCEIKAAIVARDEHEHGERALLNLGHTFGHAIESATGYTRWLHGEAVGAGMAAAAAMSQACGFLGAAEVERVNRLLQRAGLPTSARDVAADAVLERMQLDKKVQDGRVRLVLLRSIGEAYLSADYPPAALRATLQACFG